jgi:hypothetical protein
VGDTNRTISETPMNQASSRSHCIFTLHLEARPVGGDTVRRSKLHLVDLAGSERVRCRLQGSFRRWQNLLSPCRLCWRHVEAAGFRLLPVHS